MSVDKKQIAVISGILIVIVLLLFANTQIPKKEEVQASDHAGPNDIALQTLVGSVKNALTNDQKAEMDKREATLKTANDKQSAYYNIVYAWDSLRQPVAAAYFMEEAAKTISTSKNWEEAGNRYYAATRFSKDADRPLLYSKAINCFEKALELNPNNTELKINLAACYVEGSAEPMKGIGMLKEIEKTDSNNVNLQLNFAFFSEKSGQWDKAIARFEKVLEIQPDFIEAYLHLADAYQQKGDKVNAIKNLEKYITLVDDVTIKTEIQDYINKLKN
jgi:tetratricopeptide (TPR) repeat protein